MRNNITRYVAVIACLTFSGSLWANGRQGSQDLAEMLATETNGPCMTGVNCASHDQKGAHDDHDGILDMEDLTEMEALHRRLSEANSEDDDKRQLYRIIMMSCIFVVSLLIFVPFCPCCKMNMEQRRQSISGDRTNLCSGRAIQFLNCFAGGILLSLSLCHILPESFDAYN